MGNLFTDNFLNNVIESGKQKNNLARKPLLEFLKSNSKIKCPRNSASEDNLQCLFGTWLDLSDLSSDSEPKSTDSNMASFRVSVLSSLFS